MIRKLALLTIFTSMAPGAVVIDRIAVIVGKHAIKLSDVDRDLRVTEFLNREPLKLNSDARRQAADRLIDQVIIGDEIKSEQIAAPNGSDADALLNRLRRDRFGGSDPRLRQELSAYGLTEDGLQAQLLWQIEVLRFIDQRFRPGVLVMDEEVRAYYDEHRSELARQYPQTPGFEQLEPKIRASLEGERINQSFVQWLDRARQRNRIEYRQGAFQ
jgi:peptidyl-prolyl cis-trans isomerase SurA